MKVRIHSLVKHKKHTCCCSTALKPSVPLKIHACARHVDSLEFICIATLTT